MKEIRTTSQAVIINKKQFMNDYHLISKLERFEGPQWLWRWQAETDLRR